MCEPPVVPAATPVSRVIQITRQALRDWGMDPSEAGALIALATGYDKIAQIRERDTLLTVTAAQAMTAVLGQRLSGIPFARLAGEREFWSLPFQLSPATLDPRADSEALVEAALDQGATTGRLLDLGTGSGCLAIAVLTERPNLTGIAIDLSPEAATVAHRNATRNGVGERFTALVSDWADALNPATRFDLILSNPPYITQVEMERLDPAVRDHDPHLALVAGADGHLAYRRLFPAIAQHLAAEGMAIVELAADRAREIATLAQDTGLTVHAIRNDLAGRPRALILTHRL